MHTVTGDRQARRLQQIALNHLHLGAKKSAGFFWVTAKNPQAGTRFEQGANTMPANKTGCSRDEYYSSARVDSACHGDLFTNLILPSIVLRTTDEWRRARGHAENNSIYR
jgi:hypothetical protein